MRPDPRRATLEIPVEPGEERFHRGNLALVLEPRAGQAELVRAVGKTRSEQRERLQTRLDERCTELRDLLRPRRQRLARGVAGADPAEGSVALTDSRCVFG